MNASATAQDSAAGSRASSDEPLVSVRDLNVRFATEDGVVHAVRGIDFDLEPGKVLGIVGESGSGKSVTSLAVMGLLTENADVRGSIRLGGRELVGLSDKEMSRLRGKDIAMVFQDPLSSLTPVLTIGQQLTDAIRIHNRDWPKSRVHERAVELLTLVGIPSPEQRLKAFPHEFSGGMRQRVMIAIAIANNPKVLICDEPTTALDVTIQAQVLEVLKVAQRETGAAVIMITHDLGVIAGFADEVLVMYAGKAIETGTVDEVFYDARMPYTMGLLASIPRVDRSEDRALIPIHGTPPNLLHPPTGCSFAPRCPLVSEECRKGEPPLLQIGPRPVSGADAPAGADETDNACSRALERTTAHASACLKADDLVGLDAYSVYHAPEIAESPLAAVERSERAAVLELIDVKKHFPLTKGALVKKRIGTVKAVDGLTLDIREGECLSIVGESGSGKTTTLLEIMEFAHTTDGEIRINGHSTRDKANTTGTANRRIRSDLQMVFQDPSGALDPRFTVYEILAEPLQQFGHPKDQIETRIRELMKTVGLQPDHVNRFPSQFSGGQRQRIGIARALASNPKLVVLDEPVSALDVSVQAGVINLLASLRAELGLSYLLVAHDLSVVRHISDRVAVMYLGKIVEIGTSDEVFDHPRHPYTQALLSAIPIPDPKAERARQRIILTGDLPSPLDAPEGCNFASRCPVFALLPEEKKDTCRTTVPPLQPDGTGQSFACFYPADAGEIAHSHSFMTSPAS
ncbi:ABC transporter ATP-binding protein [Arthrobacter sp. UM1]|uniref:dipeptide ABC transporter ATP-binding protein n=1 Tax=Arthrobacter sp. UM1 TaxID=2766776 RepID=UPI001CF61C2D|nr:ABC transporter ATP-binding protein [Arthrobacter sp. UM1]